MNIFNDIKISLTEAIDYEAGKLKARKKKFSILPLEQFTPQKIKEIRNKTGLTQVLFAEALGVSIKTIEAWESGKNHPNGPTCRLLSIINIDPSFLNTIGIVNFNNKLKG